MRWAAGRCAGRRPADRSGTSHAHWTHPARLRRRADNAEQIAAACVDQGRGPGADLARTPRRAGGRMGLGRGTRSGSPLPRTAGPATPAGWRPSSGSECPRLWSPSNTTCYSLLPPPRQLPTHYLSASSPCSSAPPTADCSPARPKPSRQCAPSSRAPRWAAAGQGKPDPCACPRSARRSALWAGVQRAALGPRLARSQASPGYPWVTASCLVKVWPPSLDS